MVVKVGVAVGIVSPAHCGQELFPLPVSVAAILKSVDGRRREMSGNVDSVIFKPGLVENVGKFAPLPLFTLQKRLRCSRVNYIKV